MKSKKYDLLIRTSSKWKLDCYHTQDLNIKMLNRNINRRWKKDKNVKIVCKPVDRMSKVFQPSRFDAFIMRQCANEKPQV